MTESPHPRPVVLAADDDENAHVLMKMAFNKSKAKAALISVDDGAEVIRYISGEGKYSDRKTFPLPNLILLDLKMPKVSGFGVLDYVQKHPKQQTFPIIVFSSSDNDTDIKRAQMLGCHSYVVKPANFEKLVEFVRAIEVEFCGTQPATRNSEEAPDFSQFLICGTNGDHAKAPNEKTSQESLADSPEIFRSLIEQVKDYGIFILDKEGYVRSWNEGGRRIKGYESHEIIGRHFSEFYAQHDRDNQKPEFELRMAREMGRYEEEGWRLRKDGSRFWANVIITPLNDANGKVIGFAKVTRDLTQRKIHEDSLQKLLDSEERFRLLVDQVKDYAIFILDAKGNISSWNQGARRLKGYTADEVLGKHFSIFYPPEALATDHPAKELSIAIREGRYEEENWRVRKGGSRFWANVVITALWDKRGNLTGFAKVTKDLTNRKKRDDLLRQRTEELEAFAHTLSHDLRAPLRSISSFSQILKDNAGELSEQEKGVYVQKIFNAARAMETLVSDVLKLSQLSLAPATEESISLMDILNQSLQLLETQILSTQAHIEINEPLPVLKANRTLLTQIFTNLIANALKFTRKGEKPTVEVFATRQNEHFEIHVKDYGVGIAPQFHEMIFKAFERGPANEETTGTGVGLAIVKKAAERLGGDIVLNSKPGEGSDFIVRVPCEVASFVAAS